MIKDTIAAISTGMAPSGIGKVRLSGDSAIEIVDQIFRSPGGNKSLKNVPSHTIHYGHIYEGSQMIDEVLVLIMKAPRTYTTEDVVEIDCHGGIVVMKKILETVIKYGARPAEPGEFTKRAFLNGRIDLSQAEAVIDIINSKNEYALQSSVNQLKGSVHKKIDEIRGKIIHHTAFIETALDDPEHYDVDGYGDELQVVVEELISDIQKLLDTADDGRIIKEGIKTVIVGKPNAGKSSLLNVLVGEDRAIVTDIAGTTRDVLEESIQLHGISLNIMDTAGIRDTDDIVEKIGVDKAKAHANEADLIIYVVDASRDLDENDFDITTGEIYHIYKENENSLLLSDLQKYYDDVSKFKNFDKKFFVFGNDYGIRPLAYKQAQRRKGEIAEKANVKQIRLHDFRHSCASLLVNNQAPITVVSSFMGHSNTTETLKTYSHLFKGKLNETMDIINNLSK